MKILFIIPGDINLPTGGYRYDKEIINAWKNSSTDVDLVSINGNYPFPCEEEKQSAITAIEGFKQADIAVVDGLLGGTAPAFMETLSKKMPVVALIHHPLCLENGLNDETAKRLENTERHGLDFTSAIITTSPTTSKTVENLFGFEETKIHTVLPGVERGAISKGSETEEINLLCVGSIIERKGHKYLLNALSKLQNLNWHLDCIGSTAFDAKLFDELQTTIKEQSLSKRVIFHGEVEEDQIEQAYSKADVFVLPSLYEGYGMAYAEAIVRGIPVIGTKAGAIPQTVPHNCGILIEPSNVEALQEALSSMITNNDQRNQYRQNALKAEPHFPTWQNSANLFLNILKEVS